MTSTLDLTDVDLWRDLHLDDELECNSTSHDGRPCSTAATRIVHARCNQIPDRFWCQLRFDQWVYEDIPSWITCAGCDEPQIECWQTRVI